MDMEMSEPPRRLNFTTIGPMGKVVEKSPSSPSSSSSSPNKKQKKSSTPSTRPPTIRFTLKLRESNDKTCPEFSYADLMKNSLGDCKNADPIDVEDGEDVENEKLVALARSFEERYGPKQSQSNKRCDAIQDLVDLGDGYDETDPFVDNSEAYDELVPACLTTKLGGFYINSGVLDFRDVSDDSSDDFVSSPMKKKKKSKQRVIASDPESASETEVKTKIPKIRKLKDGMNKERRKKSLGDKEFKKPRKPANKDLLIRKKTPSSSTVKELLKQQTATPSTPTTTTTPTTSASTSNNGHTSDHPNGNNNYLITSATVAGLLSQDKSSSSSPGYVQPVVQLNAVTPTTPSVTQVNDAIRMESVLSSGQSFNSSIEDSDTGDAFKFLDPESIPKLSDGIPDPLEKRINQLKQAAKDSVEGKCKFFTTEVNKMLLEIETESRLLNCSQRSSIYAHLGAFLPCSKETLLKRAKKLILTQQDDKLKEPTQRLRDAINEEMPAQLEKYKNEYHGTSLEIPNPITDNTEMKAGSTESDEEKSSEADKNEKVLMMNRKFDWNDNIRSLLCDIVNLKLESYGMSKLRAQSAEEYLKSFLKLEVKPLWPKGWMDVRILFKESRTVHDKMTLYKTKKVPLFSKTPLSISVGNIPNINTKDHPSPHSNNSSSTNVCIDSASGLLLNAGSKTDVTPILTALANEMMDHSPTVHPENVPENKNLWNLLKYPESQAYQSGQSFGGGSGPMTSTPLGQIPLYFSSPEGGVKGERHSPNDSIKESPGSAASSASMYHHSLSSTPNLNPVSVLSSQCSSPEISPTMPSVKACYPQLSPTTTPTSTKQQSLGISSMNLGKTPLHSQAQFSSSNTMPNMSDSERPNQPCQAAGGGLAAALLARLSPQQVSPTGIPIGDALSQNYHSYGLKDSALSVKSDPKHNQHNGGQQQSTSTSALKPSQVSPTYQNIKQKDSSPPMQSKQLASSQVQMQNVKIMTKTLATKKDPSLPSSVSPENTGNNNNLSPGQFSPGKDDCKNNTYLAEFQRYAASCLKTPLASSPSPSSQKVKMQQPIASTAVVTLATTPVSKGGGGGLLDVKPLPQQTRSSYQLGPPHSLTTTQSPTQHHLSKIDIPSAGVQQQQQQPQQHGLHQSHPQQQQQKPMTLGMSQNIHQPPHHPPLKSHLPSSHPPHPQHSKPWRPPPQQEQSSQQHNRHQPMPPQQPLKSYSSSSSSSSPHIMSASPLSQVVNYQASQQQQLNVQKQSHVKVQPLPQHSRTAISPQQQQHQIKVDSVLKHLSTTSSPPVQTVSSLTATRHPHQSPTSVLNTSNNGNKMLTEVTSSQRGTGIHNLHSATSNLSLQSPPPPSPSSSLKQQQTRSHCLEAALSVSPSPNIASTSSATLGSASSGSVYKLPTITNITSSVGSAAAAAAAPPPPPPHQQQHLPFYSSPPSQPTATTMPQQHPGMMRGGQAGLQLRAVLPSSSKNSGGGGSVSYSAMSASPGKSSAQTWNVSGGLSQASSATSSSSSSSGKRTSSPVFTSPSSYQLQHGSTTSQNYMARTLPGLALDKMQSSLSGSIPPSQLNQEGARHSKSANPKHQHVPANP